MPAHGVPTPKVAWSDVDDGDPLQRLVARARGPVLVLHDALGDCATARLAGPHVTRLSVGDPVPARRRALVLLAVGDVGALRRAVSLLPPLGSARTLACWLAEADQPALPTARPEWPPISQLNARTLPDGAALTVLRVAEPMAANPVFSELARRAAPGAVGGSDGVVVATTQPDPATAPPVDPGLRVLRAGETIDPGAEVPPDVLLGRPATPRPAVAAVTGRAPTLVTEVDAPIGPLDEAVLNPTGFIQRPTGPLQDLAGLRELDLHRGPTPALVSALRAHAGAQLSWREGEPTAVARTAAGLAMAGVPVVGAPSPETARHLGPRLRAVLAGAPDATALDDSLRREEYSVALRRAALLEHSTLGWRRRLAEAAGMPGPRLPGVSVLLATMRPELLGSALRQVAAQQEVDLELVVVGHGFAPDPGLVRAHGIDQAVVLSRPAHAPFGEVLAAAAQAASGDVLAKMDDDDFYGPHFLLDLLLARRYAGAALVGTPAEFVYLEGPDLTIRRTDPSEVYEPFVAGGTMVLDRDLLVAVGGFRSVHRFVDKQLRTAAREVGAVTYRAHGLGYVLRRRAAGHTWEADASYFLDPARLDRTERGLAPSRVLRPLGTAEVPAR